VGFKKVLKNALMVLEAAGKVLEFSVGKSVGILHVDVWR